MHKVHENLEDESKSTGPCIGSTQLLRSQCLRRHHTIFDSTWYRDSSFTFSHEDHSRTKNIEYGEESKCSNFRDCSEFVAELYTS